VIGAVRALQPEDHAALVGLWHGAWHDAHATTTPAVVVAARTTDFFARKVAKPDPHLRVAGPVGAPLGLCVTNGDELEQLFLAPQARGTGLAAILLQDGEDRLRAAGVTNATLVCVTANLRAKRFYIRAGWQSLEETTVPADGFSPPVLLNVTRFGKQLALQPPPCSG
jgi:GNAT superfamily N-acetyltransferase